MTQAEIISRNILRWQGEQERRQEKHAKIEALAILKGISLSELKEQRAAKYRLANCRATIGEIIKTHEGKV